MLNCLLFCFRKKFKNELNHIIRTWQMVIKWSQYGYETLYLIVSYGLKSMTIVRYGLKSMTIVRYFQQIYIQKHVALYFFTFLLVL